MMVWIGIINAALLGLYLPYSWNHSRRATVAALFALSLLLAIVFTSKDLSLWAVLFDLLTLYQLINLFRIYLGRIHPDYLRRSGLQTTLFLWIAQLIIAICATIWPHPHGAHTLAVLATGELVLAVILFSSTERHLRKTKTLQATAKFTDKELPTVSVLVPARNETDDLFQCLTALVASNYPKLEIIVLDDNSQDKRTPEIIRGFAHDGVRFIAGKKPDRSWLAKNFAYQQLADASSGDYLLFCGVDTRLEPNAIRELITTLLAKKKSMLSILPYNAKPRDWRVLLIQPLRYAWELCLPRRLFDRPAVLSTCWIIERSALTAAGSFKATSRSILPESHLARATARNDGYSFLRSNLLISTKPFVDQYATAIRMRYPQMHRRPEQVALVSLIELFGVVPAVVVALIALFSGHSLSGMVALAAFLLLATTYWSVTGIMYGRPVFWSIILVPFATLFDVFLLNESMLRYEFGEVQWKGRPVSEPVMRLDWQEQPE